MKHAADEAFGPKQRTAAAKRNSKIKISAICTHYTSHHSWSLREGKKAESHTGESLWLFW